MSNRQNEYQETKKKKRFCPWSKELLGEDDPCTLVNTLVVYLIWQVLFAFKWRGTQLESSVFLNWRLLVERTRLKYRVQLFKAYRANPGLVAILIVFLFAVKGGFFRGLRKLNL